jgi:uncharacterized membrane protein
VLVRRVFLASATIWAVAIPVAAYAASRPAASSGAYGFALAVYAIGRMVCHQLPVRSFHLWFVTLPVCARCTGIYAGAAVTALAFTRLSAPRTNARLTLFVACLPTAATLVFEWTTGTMPANWIRALAGLPLGAAVAWAIAMVD